VKAKILFLLGLIVPARVANIEAIHTAGRARAGAQSALRVSHAVDVSF
jgi:hypothetical protein